MHWLWPLSIALGISVRLLIWWATLGSNDVWGWIDHARNVGTLGLSEAYRTVKLYNHPPLMGLYASWVGDLGSGDAQVFARLIKLPPLLGEGIAMYALARIGGIRLAALFALMPAPILVASYHGNTDCLYAAFVLVAAAAWDRKSYMLAGFALAAALNVKLIPLVLVPLFVIAAPDRRAFLRFSFAMAVGLLPYVWPVLQAGEAMYRNMVQYNSNPDEWGWLAMLNDAEMWSVTQPFATPMRSALLAYGRYIIMGGSIGLALMSRFRLRLSMCEQVALVGAWFLFFAPGFGVQYVAFIAPVLFAVSWRAGVLWGVSSGVFVGAIYVTYLAPGGIWKSDFHAPFPGWTPELGLVAWAGLGAWIFLRVTDAWHEASSREGPMSTDSPPESAALGSG